MMPTELLSRVAQILRRHDCRIVLAESCTAGLASALLGQIAGISAYLCGSAVTYRTQTKEAWLQIDANLLAQHTAVSQPVTEAMALSVLRLTPEADLSLAITGHLGPDAPPEQDGQLFLCLATRGRSIAQEPPVGPGELPPEPGTAAADSAARVLVAGQRSLSRTGRAERQHEAALLALEFLIETLERTGGSGKSPA